MDMLLIGVVFIVVAGSLLIGYRLGRDGGIGRGSRQTDSAAEYRARDTEQAIERAVKYNQQTAELVQKMRDILSRHNNESDDSTDSVGAPIDND